MNIGSSGGLFLETNWTWEYWSAQPGDVLEMTTIGIWHMVVT
jgi:hypothetical protein